MAHTITFISTDQVNIANSLGTIDPVTIASCDLLGAFTINSQIVNVPASSNITVMLEDGFYRITGTTLDKVFYIYHNIIEHLKLDVKELLLNSIPKGISPAGYDLTVLTLLSNLIIGNTTYHNVSYSSSLVSDGTYATIASVFAQCIKYIESSLNSTQSNLPSWLISE